MSAFTCYRTRRGLWHTRYRGVSHEDAIAVARAEVGNADGGADRRAKHTGERGGGSVRRTIDTNCGTSADGTADAGERRSRHGDVRSARTREARRCPAGSRNGPRQADRHGPLSGRGLCRDLLDGDAE